jgi:hypothetical protein
MALTAYPQEFQKNAQSYISAGATFAGQIQTLSGTVSLNSPLQNITSGSGTGTGYQKLVMSSSCAVTWNTSSLISKYGHVWYLEVYNPMSSLSTTSSATVTGTIANVPTQTLSGTGTGGQSTITVASTAGIYAGMAVTVPLAYINPANGNQSQYLTAGTTVVSYTSTVITISNPLLANMSGTPVIFTSPFPTITLGSSNLFLTNSTGIVTGMTVSGPGIAQTTTVTSVTGNLVVISNPVTSPLSTGAQVQFSYSAGTWASGASYLPLTSVAGLVVGSPLSGTGFQTGTTVTSLNGNVVGLSLPTNSAIASGTAVTSTPSLTWSSVLWHNNVTPTQASNGRSIYEFYTPDAGTTIYGRQIMATLAGA